MTESARREEAFRSALGRLPLAVIVVDGQRRLNAYNQRAISLFEREGLAGDLLEARPKHPLATLIKDIAAAKDVLDECSVTFPSGRKYRVEPSRRSEKGMDRWLILLVSPLAETQTTESFGFTPREREVADLLVDGASTESICETMKIARETLKTHMRRLFEKTGTNSRAALVARLLKRD